MSERRRPFRRGRRSRPSGNQPNTPESYGDVDPYLEPMDPSTPTPDAAQIPDARDNVTSPVLPNPAPAQSPAPETDSNSSPPPPPNGSSNTGQQQYNPQSSGGGQPREGNPQRHPGERDHRHNGRRSRNQRGRGRQRQPNAPRGERP